MAKSLNKPGRPKSTFAPAHTLTVELRPSMYDALKTEAFNRTVDGTRTVTMSELVREALMVFLKISA